MTSSPSGAAPGPAPRSPEARSGPDPASAAAAKLAEALKETGAPDPRADCRQLLRALRQVGAEEYSRGVGYYEQTLIPSIATGSAAPLDAWLEYAVHLAQLAFEGRITAIDRQGRGRPFQGPGDPGDLLLHFPSDSRKPVVRVWAPASPSAAQAATSDWLVERRRELR